MGEAGSWVKQEYYDRFRRGRGSVAKNNADSRMAALQRMHMKTFTEMAMNRFEWTGLPDSVDLRYLEHTLFYNALAVFFIHEDMGALVLKGTGQGPLNMYDNYSKFRVLGNKFVSRTLNSDERWEKNDDGEMVQYPPQCVPIWANYLRTPDLDYAMIYAYKLADLDLTIEINAHNSRYSKVIASSESGRLTSANVVRQIDEGVPAVFIDEVFKTDDIVAFDLAIPSDIHLNLPILRTRIHSDAMSLFGINNSNQDKKERLVADEVAANNDQVAVMRAINLNARQEACKEINSMAKAQGLELNIWCEYKTDSVSVEPKQTEQDGGESGSVHSDTE